MWENVARVWGELGPAARDTSDGQLLPYRFWVSLWPRSGSGVHGTDRVWELTGVTIGPNF